MWFPPECRHGPVVGAGDSCEHQGENPGEGSSMVVEREKYIFILAVKTLLYFGFF